MPNSIARIGIYGDLHLSSKNYGAHKNYPKETLEVLSKITEITEKRNLTHLIGLGDFSFGRFHSLEYRLAVEEQLEKQFKLVNGNRYEIFGNHDEAGYGKTERDFYISKGLLKPSQNFSIGCLNITMVDYGKDKQTPVNIIDTQECVNVILAHNYYKFNNTKLPNFGTATILDTMSDWYGADLLICGHIHKRMEFDGYITKDDMAHQCHVEYPGCMARPAYQEGMMDTEGVVIVIEVFDDNTIDVSKEIVTLWDLSESFNIGAKALEKAKQTEKENRVDISDVVKQLDAHDRNVGNPEDMIMSLDGVDPKYKAKAVALLKEALG